MGASQSDRDVALRSELRRLWLAVITLAWLAAVGLSLAAAPPAADPAGHDAESLDLQLKRGQIELLDRDRRLRERELAKPADNSSWTWGSPLVVAVFAAAVAALGSALVALLNGRSQRQLESSKAESDRILEVVKTGDPEKAAVNLRFLMDAGLVGEPKRVAQLNAYLRTRQAGAGVALPTPGRFAFATHGALSEDVQKDQRRRPAGSRVGSPKDPHNDLSSVRAGRTGRVLGSRGFADWRGAIHLVSRHGRNGGGGEISTDPH